MMTLYHNQQKIMVEGMIKKVIFRSLEGIPGHAGQRKFSIWSTKFVLVLEKWTKVKFLRVTLRVVRRNKIRLQILINPDPAQKDFLDFHFFIQFHSKIFFKNFSLASKRKHHLEFKIDTKMQYFNFSMIFQWNFIVRLNFIEFHYFSKKSPKLIVFLSKIHFRNFPILKLCCNSRWCSTSWLNYP